MGGVLAFGVVAFKTIQVVARRGNGKTLKNGTCKFNPEKVEAIHGMSRRNADDMRALDDKMGRAETNQVLIAAGLKDMAQTNKDTARLLDRIEQRRCPMGSGGRKE